MVSTKSGIDVRFEGSVLCDVASPEPTYDQQVIGFYAWRFGLNSSARRGGSSALKMNTPQRIPDAGGLADLVPSAKGVDGADRARFCAEPTGQAGRDEHSGDRAAVPAFIHARAHLTDWLIELRRLTRWLAPLLPASARRIEAALFDGPIQGI